MRIEGYQTKVQAGIGISDFFLSFVFVGSIVFFSPLCAYAEDGSMCETACIDTHNLEIKDVMREGTRTYAIPAAKTDDERNNCEELLAPEICETGGVVTCDEAVDYPQFKYARHHYGDKPDNSLALINERIKNMAATHACGIAFDNVGFGMERIYARDNLISIVFSSVDYLRGAGGSCHGDFETMTFNTRDGATPLSLEDIIKVEDYPALKATLLRELKESRPDKFEDSQPNQSQERWRGILQSADKYLSDQAWKGGFFIEHGKVQINIAEFLFSCADGNFNPVEVPDAFLKSDFLTVLKNAR